MSLYVISAQMMRMMKFKKANLTVAQRDGFSDAYLEGVRYMNEIDGDRKKVFQE